MKESSYIVSARKYRPVDFEEVVGQKAITDTLEQSIDEGCLAQALLFCGPHGVGKTTCARILARKINEISGPLEEGAFNFNIFELDAASNNSVDDIRNLIDQVRFAPQQGRYKVYIIDEVHMLSQAAFNAFLKTLEEPPSHAIFILATTEKHKILPTILSRCQVYEFRRISVEDIKVHLKKIAQKEGIEAGDEAFFLIAQRADGALRDALSLFDRLVSFSGKVLTKEVVMDQLGILDRDFYFKMTDLFLKNDIPHTLLLFDEVLQEGFDAEFFIGGLTTHFRDLLVSKDPRTFSLLEFDEKTRQSYLVQAKQTSSVFLIKALELCKLAEMGYKSSKNRRLSVEIALMQLVSLSTALSEVKKKLIFSPVREKILNHLLKTKKNFKPDSVLEEHKADVVCRQSASDSTPVRSPKQLIEPSYRSPSFSIHQVLEESQLEEQTEPTSVDFPSEAYTLENFKRSWDAFFSNTTLKKNMTLWNILSHLKWDLVDNNKVFLYFSSHAEAGEFSSIQQKFLEYLWRELNNHYIQFELIVKADQEPKTIYPPEERYRFLVEKYPHLAHLKERLGLDLYD
ncbi:MAG: DNA polymerase III subunit gamma/tau [Flavobacteriales bacterium Tduv]